MSETEKNLKNPFQHTLNLPKTEFSIRANAAIKEPEILKNWEAENIYEKSALKNKNKKKFILHDGPPYANGHLHIGHAFNNVLKDIVCKVKRMTGHHVPLIPGSDCHGLPIELKVASELGLEKNKESIDRVEFKKSCREYANKWIDIQRDELKELGKLADYDNAYRTMDKLYEADILRALSIFVKKGFIERKGKSIPWCASCQTVLATAEIEYQDRKDPSLFILFPLEDASARLIFPYAFEQQPNLKIGFLVWTTTPWTIPLNRAVVLNPTAKYVIIQGKEADQGLIVGKDLAGKICSMLNIEKKEICELDADVFLGKTANHPFIQDFQIPVLIDEMVTTEDGTACLHCAPGCGPDDYLLGVKSGLEIFSPISAEGKYAFGIKPEELEGMPVSDGQIWVIKKLAALGRLIHKTSITHSYPHCWRCHNGLIFRATEQWFCNLQKDDLVQNTLKEIEKISFVPDWGKNRLHAFTSNRTEWCISRQRIWGVPIAAVICDYCEQAFTSEHLINKVADGVEKEGIEYWDNVSVQDLAELGALPKDFKCLKCGSSDLTKFRKEKDILDVWFESGVSHYAVLSRNPETLGVPADLYLEGSDQHRGWFQSSLLSSMVMNGHTCTKQFLTHGFVVDEAKHKMSKSIGNVVAPQDVIKKYSRDILRLWVASVDYEGDAVVSDKLLENTAEIYRKIRNTCRFLVSNLYDFDISKDAVSLDDLQELDKYALAKLVEVDEIIKDAYQNYKFATVVQTLNNYCTVELSALYLDIVKDRLYVEQSDGRLRRSAQTVLYNILDSITRLMAPILSFLAEEVSSFYQKNKNESIHLQRFADVVIPRISNALEVDLVCRSQKFEGPEFEEGINLNIWALLEAMRDTVLKSIERLREKGVVKHSLESKVELLLDKNSEDGRLLIEFLEQLAKKEDAVRFLKDWLIVSQVSVATNAKHLEKSDLDWLFLSVGHADGVKCPRCWQWELTDHVDGLCCRCCKVLKK
ncbi:MAG: Isoleucine-tRNA ligase [candidate division TM6 bacterium GW2011_GWF2_37_49]|nr:MAG: Isoleucine-tRNA ligase [candidate division TM6 bacterium GW2011_GWF2_37_49]